MTNTDRGLAVGFALFVIIIIFVALIFTLFTPAITGVTDTSGNATTNSDAQDVIDEREQIWDLIPFYGLLIAAVFIIAKSTVESRRP